MKRDRHLAESTIKSYHSCLIRFPALKEGKEIVEPLTDGVGESPLFQCSLRGSEGCTSPRIHDLRHTFAVTRLLAGSLLGAFPAKYPLAIKKVEFCAACCLPTSIGLNFFLTFVRYYQTAILNLLSHFRNLFFDLLGKLFLKSVIRS